MGVFRPERWFERDHAMIQKAFNPFSFGPRRASSALTALQQTDASRLIRACVGRNLASMELLIIVSSILRRYHFVLACHPRRLPSQAGGMPCVTRVETSLKEESFDAHALEYLCRLPVCFSVLSMFVYFTRMAWFLCGSPRRLVRLFPYAISRGFAPPSQSHNPTIMGGVDRQESKSLEAAGTRTI